MSGPWDRHSSSNAQSATGFGTFVGEKPWAAQFNDNLDGDEPLAAPIMATNIDNDDVDVEITHGQKMLSAMSGSLLTSLLGMSLLPTRLDIETNIFTYSYSARCRARSTTVSAYTFTSYDYRKARRKLATRFQLPPTEPWSHSLLSGGLLQQWRILLSSSEDWGDQSFS